MVQDLVDFGTLSYVFPKLDIEQISEIVNNYNKETSQSLSFSKKDKDITALDDSVKKLLYDIFVKQSLTSKFALKYRFLRILNHFKTWAGYEIKNVSVKMGDLPIDLIIENSKDKNLLWVFFIEVMEEKFLKEIRQKCLDRKKGTISEVPSRVIIFTSISHREISIDEPILLRSNEGAKYDEIPVELWIEEKNGNRPFRDDDLLIIDDVELAGFNFSSLENILDAIKQFRGRGQYQIYRVLNYFSRNAHVGSPTERELIWKGILFPEKLFNE